MNNKANKSEVSNVSSQVTTVQANLNNISQKISHTETNVNKINSDINTFNSKINSVEQKITPSSITNTVLSSQSYKENLKNMVSYSNFTQYKQENNKFQWQIKEQGGYNLIKNSGALGGTKFWHTTATQFASYVDDQTAKNAKSGKGFFLKNTKRTEQFAYTNTFLLKPNTKYTISFLYSYEAKCKGIELYVLTSSVNRENTKDTGYKYATEIVSDNNNPTWFKKVTKTFTTASDVRSGCVRFDNNGLKNGSECFSYLYDLILTEGELEKSWSPNPNEVYGSNLKLDTDELKIEFENGDYSLMGRKGIEHWHHGMARPYHYLFHRGSVDKVNSQQTVRIHVPEEFKGKDYGMSWWAGNVFPQNDTDLIFSANVELVGQNKQEGWFDLKASLMVRNPKNESSPFWRGKMNVIYTLIA